MILSVIFVICMSFTEVPATHELAQLFGNAVQSAGEAAGEVVGLFANKLARDAEDFEMFIDKSKQVQRNFTVEEVAKCTGLNGGCLYIIYDDMVLDLTDFAPFHCGGTGVLLRYAGQDATAAMRSSSMPARVFDIFLRRFQIGRVVRTTKVSSSSSSSMSSSSSSSSSSTVSSTASTPAASPAAVQPCGFIPALLGLC